VIGSMNYQSDYLDLSNFSDVQSVVIC
jgi:hypothetical protein